MEFQEQQSHADIQTINFEPDNQRVEPSATEEHDLFDEALWTQQDGDLPLWRMWR
ncbi:hypothetical protein ACXZ1K_06370 [Pedobacter sp. PWIIR3]